MLKKIFAMSLLLLLFSSAQANVDNTKWVNNFYNEVLNKGNLDLIDSLVSDKYQEHEPLPGFELNRDGLKEFFAMMLNAFPDLHNEIEFTVTQDDKIVSYITLSGTHKNTYMGVPATGNKFEMTVVDIIKIENGKMTDHWGVGDYMTMMVQLSIIVQ